MLQRVVAVAMVPTLSRVFGHHHTHRPPRSCSASTHCHHSLERAPSSLQTKTAIAERRTSYPRRLVRHRYLWLRLSTVQRRWRVATGMRHRRVVVVWAVECSPLSRWPAAVPGVAAWCRRLSKGRYCLVWCLGAPVLLQGPKTASARDPSGALGCSSCSSSGWHQTANWMTTSMVTCHPCRQLETLPCCAQQPLSQTD